MNEPIHIISLGAGVQSSTMALMAAHGEITPMPKCAIFADTQDEPQSVYRWLDWLEKQLPFPVHRVSKGSLSQSALRLRKIKDPKSKFPVGTTYVNQHIPIYAKNTKGATSPLTRRCTQDFKVTPLVQMVKRIAGPAKHRSHVFQWMGISLDEIHRTRTSPESWQTFRYPLIDLRMRRHDCLLWMKRNGFPAPPRSACVYCPYHSNAEWRRLKMDEPEEFKKAVLFERQLRQQFKQHDKITSMTDVFLHNSLVPLDEVDFRTDEDHGQQTMFGNDCLGMCGI